MKIAIVHPRSETLERLKQIVLGVPGYDVIWVARDGVEAVTKYNIDPPDLTLMAIDLPVLDGVTATRRMMARSHRALLAMTDDLSRDSARIFEAMGHGVLDVVNLTDDPDNWPDILDTIATIGRLLGDRASRKTHANERGTKSHSLHPPVPPLIAIGASTGGPAALATILSAFPADLDAAIVIVQHLNSEFLPGLVTWLDRQTPLPVAIAGEGDHLEAGKVLVANTRNHLRLAGDSRLTYTKNPSDRPYCPSIDVFFGSAADNELARGIAVVLTGMGNDGAEGLARLRRKGWHTIAQSKATCVVYGMPKAAIALDAAAEILDLEAIAPTLLQKRLSL